MPQLEVAPRTDDVHDLPRAFVSDHAFGRELDVQQAGGPVDHAVVLGMIIRQQDGGRPVLVRAVRGRGAVRKREAGHAAIGRGGDDLAEGHVRRNRHVADIHMNAAIPAALLGFHLRETVHVLGDAVGVGIVVAVAGGALQHFPDGLVAHEVGLHRFKDFLHGEALFLIDQLLDGREGVHHRAVAEEFKVGVVDAFLDLFGMQVLVILHAQVMQDGGQGRGEVLRAQAVDDVLLLEGLAQQVDVLGLVGVVEFLPRLEAGGIAGFKADKLVAVVKQATIVHEHFNGRGEVDVHAAGGVGIAVGHAGFRAAGNRVVQRFIHGTAFDGVQRNDFLIVDQLGKP